MGIFDYRRNYKPFEYPEVTDFTDAINKSFWVHSEVDFTADTQDFLSHLDEVEQITKKAIEENFHRDETKEIEFHYLAFGSSSIDFQVRFWIDANVRISILEARSKAIKVIKRTYDEKGINIPFPIRTVRLDKSP